MVKLLPVKKSEKIIKYEKLIWNPCPAYSPGGRWDPISGFAFSLTSKGKKRPPENPQAER
jgi:hypothetical protein